MSILGINNNKVRNKPNTHHGGNLNYWWDIAYGVPRKINTYIYH